MDIDRKFVRLTEGLVHYREAGRGAGTAVPVLMLHPSPASSRALVPVLQELAATRWVIAPDTLGNGDSASPLPTEPDLQYYADSMLRLLDALGIGEVDVYGSHTGAHIGIELALAADVRVRSLVMHGIAVLDADERREFLANYAPVQSIDAIGSQFNWAWHYVRDQMIFYPHFRKTPAAIRAGGNLSAPFLHALTLDILANIEDYHKTYHAVFRHEVLERLAAVTQSVGLLAHPDDPLIGAVASVRESCPNAAIVDLADESAEAAAASTLAFMDAAG